ncbi:MAG: hypothetical protein HOY78_22290 [Saccharothrix sp.]|nr:hypothetical protein [Saccharothrix sp.]
MVTLLVDVVVGTTLELGTVVEVAVVTATEVGCRASAQFTNGLRIDRSAVDGAVTLPYHNGRTEGVNSPVAACRPGR